MGGSAGNRRPSRSFTHTLSVFFSDSSIVSSPFAFPNCRTLLSSELPKTRASYHIRLSGTKRFKAMLDHRERAAGRRLACSVFQKNFFRLLIFSFFLR